MHFLWPALLYLPSLYISDKGLDTERDLGHPRSSKPSSSQLRGWRFLASGGGVGGETCPGPQSKVTAEPHQEAGLQTLGHPPAILPWSSLKTACLCPQCPTGQVQERNSSEWSLNNQCLHFALAPGQIPPPPVPPPDLVFKVKHSCELVTLPVLACGCRSPSISLLSRDRVCSKDYNFILGLDILITF